MKRSKITQGLAVSSLAAAFAVVALTGCKDDPKPAPAPAPAAPAKPGAAAPATKPAGGDEHANATPIGKTTKGGLTFEATQDELIIAGREGAFDLKVTGYAAGAKPKAVRFWVGVESGDGSAKAKAAEESPDVWHCHVEVPKPLMDGAKFWAEVEPATGETVKASFDLKK